MIAKPANVFAEKHGLRQGDRIVITGLWAPWYKRLWRWLTRYKPPVYTVTSCDTHIFRVEP